MHVDFFYLMGNLYIHRTHANVNSHLTTGSGGSTGGQKCPRGYTYTSSICIHLSTTDISWYGVVLVDKTVPEAIRIPVAFVYTLQRRIYHGMALYVGSSVRPSGHPYIGTQCRPQPLWTGYTKNYN